MTHWLQGMGYEINGGRIMIFPNKEIVEIIRKEYPAGTRVELVKMDDLQAPPVGTKGTVRCVDDTGSILVKLDNGSCLNVLYGEDECKKYFDAVKERDKIITSIKERSKKEGWNKVILGISGGKDSAIAAALCVRALGKENVYGVMMPDGKQPDIEDSIAVIEALDIPFKTVNISEIHHALLTNCKSKGTKEDFDFEYKKESDINVGPRIRTTVLRFIGQCIGALHVSTLNLSEYMVGYFTKGGDGPSDISPLLEYTSVEAVEIGLTMPELPERIVKKTPDDGLSGIPDEEKLGVTYPQIHDYLRKGTCGIMSVDYKIQEMIKKTGSSRVMVG